jgi:xylulokinase
MSSDVLVIDSGTGAAKVECFGTDEAVLDRAVVEYQGIDPQRDQIDPEVWFAAVAGAVKTLGKKLSLETLRIIVLTGQMQDVIPVRNGRAVVPAILYFGHRTSDAYTSWLENFGASRIRSLTCNQVDTAGFPAKLLYLREQVPSILDDTEYILCGAHDYIAYRLTGVAATDPTTASTTGLFSPITGAWADEIVDSLDGWGPLLPPVHRANQVDGVILPDVADELGLPKTVQVVHGAGDVGASVLSMEMEGFSRSLYLGTSGWIQDVTELDQPGDPTGGVFTLRHPMDDRLIRVAPVLTAAGAFDWFVNRLLEADEDNRDAFFARLGRQAAAMNSRSVPLVFLPYLAGERSPFHDPDATGMFLGLRRETDQVACFRAIEEGVAFSVRSVFEALFQSRGNGTDRDNRAIQVTGGGASVEGFPQIIADVLQAPVAVARDGRFSGTGALFGVVSDRQGHRKGLYTVLDPSDDTAGYAGKYELFRKAYGVNRELMAALRSLS